MSEAKKSRPGEATPGSGRGAEMKTGEGIISISDLTTVEENGQAHGYMTFSLMDRGRP